MTRITTSEVCALGRFSRATLWRRVASGALPSPIDQGREAIFDRDCVVAALTIPRSRWRKRTTNDAQPGRPPIAEARGRETPQRRWNARRWEIT